MTRMSKLLMGAAIAVMGTASLAMAFPGDKGQSGQSGQREGRGPMFVEMFDELDADGDGNVTREELDAAGPAAAFAEADANGDGVLEADELTAFRDIQERMREERRQQRMVKRLDTDGDGKLSLEEIKAGQRGGAERMFDRLDADGDGSVNRDTVALLQKQMQERRQMMQNGRGGPDGKGRQQGFEKHHGQKGEFGRHDGRQGPMHWGQQDGPRGHERFGQNDGPRGMNGNGMQGNGMNGNGGPQQGGQGRMMQQQAPQANQPEVQQ